MKTFLLFFGFLVAPLAGNEIQHFTKAEILGDINPAHLKSFDKLKTKHCTKANAYLRDEVYSAFKKMAKEAEKDGVHFVIISATRNREYQAGIWNRKWNTFGGELLERAQKILQYSSMPGTSRHHWGTDFDLNSLNNSYFESGKGQKEYEWLRDHAHLFGFFQPYTAFNDSRDAGYREEKWHWSYYPTASKLQRAYNHLVSYQDLKGFNGSELAKELNVISNYVNGVEVPERVK